MKNNLQNHHRLHLIGIKGAGMSALATIAKKMGHQVTGSDVAETFMTDAVLEKAGMSVTTFNTKNIQPEKIDAVIYSVAYTNENPELAKAKKLNLPLFTYPQAVGELMKGKTGIGVTGCNGKTTTSAMLAYVLSEAGQDPSFIVGAPLTSYKTSSRCGESNLFVVEADDYRAAFLNYAPSLDYAVITNIEWDHPDFYASRGDMLEKYLEFVKLLPKGAQLLAYSGDEGVKKLLSRLKQLELDQLMIKTYGFEENDDYQISEVGYLEKQTSFKLSSKNKPAEKFSLTVPGGHNVLNAAATIAICQQLGVKDTEIARALKNFRGTKRRFEVKGTIDGVTMIDDYAHHPTAISKTLQATRQFYPGKKIWAVFQPHTFSRTQALLKDFAGSFDGADEVLLMDIYASAREKDTGVIHTRDLVKGAKKHHPDVRYTPQPQDVLKVLAAETQSGNVIVTMGASDIDQTVGERFR